MLLVARNKGTLIVMFVSRHADVVAAVLGFRGSWAVGRYVQLCVCLGHGFRDVRYVSFENACVDLGFRVLCRW